MLSKIFILAGFLCWMVFLVFPVQKIKQGLDAKIFINSSSSPFLRRFLKKFILNILYYRFIKKSRFFSEYKFFNVLLHQDPKMPKPPRSSQLSYFLGLGKRFYAKPMSFFPFFYRSDFKSCDGK